MVWNSTSPLGTVSVKANVTIQQQNTSYIDATMGNSTNTSKDHYWNIGADEDGHHRAIQMKEYKDTYTGAPTTPSLTTSMATAISSLANGTSVDAVLRNSTGLMQLLGGRVLCVFNCTGAAPIQADLVYELNLNPITGVPATDGVDRNGTGTYTLRFANTLPSDNYIVVGGAIKNSATNNIYEPLIFSVASGTAVNARKSTTGLVVVITTPAGTLIDPMQFWVACFGG